MYEFNYDRAGLERHKELIKEAEAYRRARQFAKQRNVIVQLSVSLLKTLSASIR